MCRSQSKWNFISFEGNEEFLSELQIFDEAESILEQYLELISPQVRETFRMRYIHQLPVKVIAQLQNIPVGTVHSRLHRGKQIILSSYHLYKGD